MKEIGLPWALWSRGFDESLALPFLGKLLLVRLAVGLTEGLPAKTPGPLEALAGRVSKAEYQERPPKAKLQGVRFFQGALFPGYQDRQTSVTPLAGAQVNTDIPSPPERIEDTNDHPVGNQGICL